MSSSRTSAKASAGGQFRHAYRTVDLEKLKPWEKNPRQHSKKQIDQLRASIRRFGFTNPLLIDEKLRLIAGHGRREAALLEGIKRGPAIELRGLSADSKRALVIADNKIALNATWDEELLRGELTALGEDFDLGLLGFDDKELAELLGTANTGPTDADDIPQPPTRAITKAGDLYELGAHRLLCGDSFEADDRKRLLGEQLVDLVLTDPPYAIYGSSTGIAADIADDKMVRPFFENLGRILLESVPEFAHVYVCCDWRSYATLWAGFKAAKLTPKNCIVWDKGGAGLGNSYANTHEFVAFFARLPPSKAMTSGNKRGQRPVHRSNIYRCNRVTGPERKHNAAKPVELLTFLIENSSDAGARVADFFGGSGSTLIACEMTGRACLTMEMEPKFCDVIVQRWEEFTGKKATRHGATKG